MAANRSAARRVFPAPVCLYVQMGVNLVVKCEMRIGSQIDSYPAMTMAIGWTPSSRWPASLRWESCS